MWLEAFNRLQKKRLQYLIWFCGASFLVTNILAQGLEIKEEAERTRLSVLKQTFYKSASTLRQQWELQDKPAQLDIAGMNVEFTARGWPVVLNNNGVDCQRIWDLLSSRSGSISYVKFDSKKEMRSARYNSCYYQISDGNWLELFYKDETIHINGFLTG